MTDTVLAQGEGETNIFLLPNGTFFVEVIIFVVVMFVLSRYIYPPIKNAMTVRHDRLQRQLEESDRAKQRFTEADERYREALSEARNESSKIRDEARSEGHRIIEELREQANGEVAQVRQRGEEQLAQQRERVVSELRDSVSQLSTTLAGRVVGTDLDGPENRARIERLLDEREQPQQGAETVRGGSR